MRFHQFLMRPSVSVHCIVPCRLIVMISWCINKSSYITYHTEEWLLCCHRYITRIVWPKCWKWRRELPPSNWGYHCRSRETLIIVNICFSSILHYEYSWSLSDSFLCMQISGTTQQTESVNTYHLASNN